MMKRNVWMVMNLVMAVCLSAAAVAAFEPMDSYDQQFAYSLCCDPTQATADATVHSWVEYDAQSGLYRYLYQIHDVSADYRINYFEFTLHESPISSTASSSYGGYSGTVYAFWSPLDDNGSVYGMGAFFASAVMAGANSYVLRMDSVKAPGQMSGLLSGFGPNGVLSLCGDVFVPAPEPTTLLLLASGAAMVMRKKRN